MRLQRTLSDFCFFLELYVTETLWLQQTPTHFCIQVSTSEGPLEGAEYMLVLLCTTAVKCC